MKIDVDGEAKKPFYGTHFVEAAPGDHDVTLEYSEFGVPVGSMSRVTTRVTVEEGKVTTVAFSPCNPALNSGAAAKLEIRGTRLA
jgi:hypothetical protein